MENLEYFEKFKNHIKVANGEIYKIPTPFCSEILEKIAIDDLKVSDNLKNDFKKWSKQVRANFYKKTKDSSLQEDKNLDSYGLYLAKELKNSLKNYYIEYKSKTHGIVAIKYLYLLADYSSCLFGDMDCFDIESLCEEFSLEYDENKKNLEKKLDDWCYRCSKYQMKFENPIFGLSGSLYKEGLEFFCEIKKFLPINCVFEYKHVIGNKGDEFLFLSMANHRIGFKNDVLGLKQIALNLEQYIRNAIEVIPMTNNAQNLTNLYENASCFVYPSLKSNSALMVKFIRNNEKLIMTTAHPIYRNIGFIYTGKIYRVYVWENGIEAQIGFTMENGRSLEFFDDNFLNKRAIYTPNIPFKARIYAVLSGLNTQKMKM